MNSRVLPVLNLIGCLALTGLVVAQWRKELASDTAIAGLKSELAVARSTAAEEAKRCAALERDIAVLKEAIEATQKSAETASRGLAEKAQLNSTLETELVAARGRVTAWETAIRERDERIRTLDADLTKTRARLDEAVIRLKAAGAR
jgi:chromosome segregation ATPase